MDRGKSDRRPAAVTARWVVPVDGEPVRGGTVELAADGTVAAVHDRPDARGEAADLGDVALLPGLVNCHAHLEFSDFSAPIPVAGTFADWIAATVAARRGREGPVMPRVNRGLAESLAAGVTTVGDIVTAGWEVAELPPARERPNVLAFHELIAPRDPAAGFAAGRAFLANGAGDPAGISRGLSPHAPYSVHPALPALLAAPHAPRVPVATHLYETREELDLMAAGAGPLAAAMGRLGATRGDFGANRLRADFLEPLAGCERGLIVHGNFLGRGEIDWLAAPERSHLSVVYCPRTHAHFGHPPHPWRDLLEAGVRVAPGTDGRGSNPDLSVWNEVRFLHARFRDVPFRTLVRMATADGADALGVPGGRIAAGAAADLCAVRLPSETGDPWTDLAHPDAAPCGTWRDGVRVAPAAPVRRPGVRG